MIRRDSGRLTNIAVFRLEGLVQMCFLVGSGCPAALFNQLPILAATSLGLLKLKGMKNDRHSAELTIFLEISIGKTRMIRLEDITTSRFFQLEACSFALLPSISK